MAGVQILALRDAVVELIRLEVQVFLDFPRVSHPAKGAHDDSRLIAATPS